MLNGRLARPPRAPFPNRFAAFALPTAPAPSPPNCQSCTGRQESRAAPRGPANYLAEIIKRTLAKLGIATELAFNLEFNHTGSTENHPLHIHGAFCIPDDSVDGVSEALRTALAPGYRQRYKNLAVHIEKPRSARWWATYCIKEYSITACRLETERGRKAARSTPPRH